MNDFQRDCCLNCCAKWDFEQQVMSDQVGDVELNSIFSLLNIQRFLAGSRIHVVLAMNTRWRLNINFVQHQHHEDTTRERELDESHSEIEIVIQNEKKKTLQRSTQQVGASESNEDWNNFRHFLQSFSLITWQRINYLSSSKREESKEPRTKERIAENLVEINTRNCSIVRLNVELTKFNRRARERRTKECQKHTPLHRNFHCLRRLETIIGDLLFIFFFFLCFLVQHVVFSLSSN